MNGIKIFNSQNNPIEIESDNNDIQIDSSIKKIKIVKDGYYSKEIIFNEFKNQDTVKLKTNIGIAQADWYKIIYYDLDKSDLRKDMIDEVNDVVSFLQAHPELKITITSFTDSRASATYNEKLSQRRTLMIEKYLLGHGIPKKQIAKSEWKGEGILVNNCGDLIPCTEEMHQLNRRTEVFISGLLK